MHSPDTMHRRIESEIEKANAIFSARGDALSLDPEVLSLTAAYRKAISRTGESMSSMGVPLACTACAGEDSGSCCFIEIEEAYDYVQLLANLLLGCSLPDCAEVPASCYFVGSRGCKLSARYYFCLHYFCPELMSLLGKDRAQALLVTIGEELLIGWDLERAIRNRLPGNGQSC